MDDPEFIVPLGSADVKRTGKDITIVTYSLHVRRFLGLPRPPNTSQKEIDVEVV